MFERRYAALSENMSICATLSMENNSTCKFSEPYILTFPAFVSTSFVSEANILSLQ